jgi:uroporphyrinogen decarboxylase
MRQAGRYLPEYRALRAKVSFWELCRNPELCAEVTVQPLRRFDLDAAILFSDILTVFDALGAEVAFEPAPVVAHPVRTAADVARLRDIPVDEALGYVFEAVRACKSAIADAVPLIGFCGAPFTTLSYLVEGGGSKEFRHTKGLLMAEPAVFEALMRRLTDVAIEYLRGQVRAGVDAVQIFESWGAALTPADYRDHVLPHLQRLMAATADIGVPRILFARGNAGLLADVRTLGADVYGIDWSIDLGRAIEVLGPTSVVQGNLDPIALFGPREQLDRRARDVLEQGRAARAHIFNLGHGISKDTDPDAVARLVDVVHEFA